MPKAFLGNSCFEKIIKNFKCTFCKPVLNLVVRRSFITFPCPKPVTLIKMRLQYMRFLVNLQNFKNTIFIERFRAVAVFCGRMDDFKWLLLFINQLPQMRSHPIKGDVLTLWDVNTLFRSSLPHNIKSFCYLTFYLIAI